MDTQALEIIGRNHLINELLLAGLEVALPIRDRGIDLIAYLDLGDQISAFTAFPIQLKASTKSSFSLDGKYEKFPNLVIAYVWGLASDETSVTYALTYNEVVQIGTELGYIQTESWLNHRLYAVTRPGRALISLLEPFRMTPEAWRRKIENLQRNMPNK